jgi:hypothetical protein
MGSERSGGKQFDLAFVVEFLRVPHDNLARGVRGVVPVTARIH